MSEPRKRGLILSVAAALVAMTLGAYSGWYYRMVNVGVLDDGQFQPAYYTQDELRHGIPTDGFDYVTFFSLIHWLGRRIRTHVWEPEL